MKLSLRFGTTLVLAAGLLPADVTYTQTTKVEGGTIVEMMQKMAAKMPNGVHMGNMQQAFQNQTYDVYLKGNKMARWGKWNATIYDLDAGTVTMIDNTRQTYRTSTFHEMQQRAEQIDQRMNQHPGTGPEFDVNVSSTGQTRTIDGAVAKEMLIEMTARQESAQGQAKVTAHVWLLPYTSASKEVVEFQRKLAAKYSNAFSSGGPGMGAAAKGINAAMKEAMNQNGYPAVTETEVAGVTMGGPMGPMAGETRADPNAPLLKTLTESSHFVEGHVDDSKFTIPAGFKEAVSSGRFGR